MYSEKSDPLVSVCCIAYNLEKYIEQTIESILEQETDFDYEIVIHDDASTDNTQQILKSYAEKYPDIIKIIFQDNNIYTSHEGGLGYMFNNHILPETRGKYIAICDGDDYWIDTYKLQKQVDFLEKKEFSACTTNALIVNEITNEKRKYHADRSDGFWPEFKVYIESGGLYPTSTLMFDKGKFISSDFYPYYDEFAKFYRNDTLFIYCLLAEGNIGYIDDCTAVYRRWDGGLYSGIMHDSDKTAGFKEKANKGHKKLLKMVDPERKKIIKRKISVDSLHILRNKQGFKKFKYLSDLHPKELVKYIFNL